MPGLNDEQFASLSKALVSEGGFTIDPKTGTVPTSGWMVGQRKHTQAQAGVASPRDIRGYTESRAAPLGKPGMHLGGWHKTESEPGKPINPTETHLDVSKRFPTTPSGHSASRRAMVQQGEQETYEIASGTGETNPTSPDTELGQKFPEFSGAAVPEYGIKASPRTAAFKLAQPEIKAWVESPKGIRNR